MGFFGRRKTSSAGAASSSTKPLPSPPTSSQSPEARKATLSKATAPIVTSPLHSSSETPHRGNQVDSVPFPHASQAFSTSTQQETRPLTSQVSASAPTPPRKNHGSSGAPPVWSSPLDSHIGPSPPAAAQMPIFRAPHAQRTQSEGVPLPLGQAKARPTLSQSDSEDPVAGHRSQLLTKPRPASFLGFLGGGGANRASLMLVSNTSKLAKNSRRLTAKPTKTMVMDAQLVESGPSRKGPTRVVAIIGDVRTGLGRMIIEELVRTRTIVVALTDAHDGQFGKELEALALSPSLFHAFPIPALFGPSFVSSEAGGFGSFAGLTSPGASTPNLSWGSSSTPSLPPMGLPPPGSNPSFNSLPGTSTLRRKNTKNQSTDKLKNLANGLGEISAATKAFNERHACLVELGNIFKSYRVDTVICAFAPRDPRDSTTSLGDGASVGPNLTDGSTSGALPPLSSTLEKARIEEMERVCLQAAVACGAGRFATCSWSPSPFSPPVHSNFSEPPDYIRRAPLSATLFRWGMLMNDLAATVLPNEQGDSALGKWLEPPSDRSGRKVIDAHQQVCYLPEMNGKGKGSSTGVSLTLAEDVARFIALACKLKTEWDWSLGTMVGERIRGGWEEIMDMVETTTRTVYRREYIKPLVEDSSSASSSTDHLSPHPNGIERHDSQDSASISSVDLSRSRSPAGRLRSPVDIDDVLRGQLAAAELDASSVRLAEFVRVWFAPKLVRLAPPVHGPRVMRSPNHPNANGGGGHVGKPGMVNNGYGRPGNGGGNSSERRPGPPPSRSSGTGQVGQVPMSRGQPMPPAGQGWAPMSGRGNGMMNGAGGNAPMINGQHQQQPVHHLQPHYQGQGQGQHHDQFSGRIPNGNVSPVGRSPLAQRVA